MRRKPKLIVGVKYINPKISGDSFTVKDIDNDKVYIEWSAIPHSWQSIDLMDLLHGYEIDPVSLKKIRFKEEVESIINASLDAHKGV